MQDPHVGRRSGAVLAAVCLAAASMPLAFTGPTVALPAIARALAATPVSINWVTNAYLLTFGSVLLASGSIADAYGRKAVFVFGTAAFAILSLLLAFVPSMLAFDLVRAAEGVAAAAALSSGMAVLAQTYPGEGRLRAFSFVGTSFGIGLSVAPIASAFLLEFAGWRSIFAMVVLFDLLAFGLGCWSMRETRDPEAGGLDWPGTITFTLALTLFTAGVLQAPVEGWGTGAVMALLGGALAAMAAFIVVEVRSARPLLDLSLFRYPRFVGVQLLAAAPAYGFVVLVILLPIRLVGVDGMSASEAGRTMVAMSAPLLFLPLVSGAMTRWISPAALCGAGLVVVAIGVLWLGRLPIGAGELRLSLPLLLVGCGISLPWGLMDGLAVSVVPSERAGMAAGIFGTVRVAGEGLALALVTALLAGLSQHAVIALGVDREHAALAAQRLVTGDLNGASEAAGLGIQPLLAAYGAAFRSMTEVLAGITAVTAAAVYLSLRSVPSQDRGGD